jgi:epoxyqueuosine reductase
LYPGERRSERTGPENKSVERNLFHFSGLKIRTPRAKRNKFRSTIPAMSPETLTIALKEESLRLGFDLAGVAPAALSADFERLRQWMADGMAADMRFFAERLDAYCHPAGVLDGARSVLVLGVNYRSVEPAEVGPGEARVARSAWGVDYHDVLRAKLHALADFHRRLMPSAVVRGVVDTAPLLERRLGQTAGLGWIGKNTTLINPRFGSWFFLAALLTTAELVPDEPFAADHCGSCRACLDACPTGALVAPHRLDSRKCISYLTIEAKGKLSQEQQAACGKQLFGCDACQEACPWNRDTPATQERAFYPRDGMNPVDTAEFAALDESAFRARFRDTPLWRARHRFL